MIAFFEFSVEQTVQQIVNFVRSHWVAWLWTAGLMLGTWFLANWRARTQWAKKEFLGRLNISLNMIRDGKLMIRTIVEKSLEDVLLNAVAVQTVSEAAKKTTEDNPLLPLPNNDAWYILNSVLNEVAEKFSGGELRRDAGLPVTTERYVLCLTRERAGDMKTQKIRAMLVNKTTLLALPDQTPQLESPNHATRFRTLQFMATTYKKDQSQFMEMEISL